MRELKPEDIKFDENSLIARFIREIEQREREMRRMCGVPERFLGRKQSVTAKARAKGFSRIPNGEEEDEKD